MKQVLIILILLAPAIAQGATLTLEETDHGPRWVLANERLRVEIDPARGARVDSFHDKRFKRSIVANRIKQGLFVDHLAQQGWPGELWERVYEAKPLERDGKETAITFSTTILGKFRNRDQPQSRGLVLRKTFRLRDGETGLHVRHTIENPTDQPRQFSLWLQNIQQLGKDPVENVAVRPAQAGVYRFKMPDQPMGEGWERYRDSIAAWTGVVDPASGQGIIYLQDYDYLDGHYNAGLAFTVEWFMAPVSLAPGQSWSTDSEVLSRRMPPDVIGVSAEMWIGASLSDDEKEIHFTVATEGKAVPVQIDGVLVTPRTGKRFPLSLKWKPGRHALKLPKDCKPPIFLDATATPAGGRAVRVAEFMGGAHYPKNEPLPGYPPMAQVARPKRHPVFPRPKVIRLDPAGAKRVLVADGILTLGMGVGRALGESGYTVHRAYEVFMDLETGIAAFPNLYEDLLAVGTVVLNNIDASLLSPAQWQILEDHIRAGGRLVLISGTATTRLGWQGSPLKGLVNATPAKDFGPRQMILAGRVKGDATLVGLLPEEAFVVTWNAPDARVLATLNGRALVAVQQVGKGRVVLLGLTGMGTPSPKEYWGSERWRQLLVHLIKIGTAQ